MSKRKKIILSLYLFIGFVVYLQLFFGTSDFFTTTYTYSLIGGLFYCYAKNSHVHTNVSLLVYALIIGIFIGELSIRYIVKYPLSYGEQNGGGYILVDQYQKRSNIRFKYLEGRKDLFTLQFDSGEIRDNNCLDYQYANDTSNTLGFRGVLPNKKKKIILVLGDSFTEGAGAPADSCFPFLLRKHIAQKDSSLDVLNAGVSGNDIFFDWKMVQKLAPKYQLKQLVFVMNTTDINDVATRGGNERFCANGLLDYHSQPWWEPVYAVSFVFRLFVHKVLHLDYSLLSPQQVETRNRLALEKISNLITNEIIPWSQKNGVAILIVTHPLSYEFDNNKSNYTPLIKTLRNIDSLKVVDCLPALKTKNNIKDLYWEHDLHFKPKGYNIITNIVIDSCYR